MRGFEEREKGKQREGKKERERNREEERIEEANKQTKLQECFPPPLCPRARE